MVATYASGDTAISGQPIVTNDALIVSSTAKTYIFNLQTHAIAQTLANGGPVSLANGVIYLAGTDGVLRTYYPNGMTAITLAMPASATEGGPTLSGTVTLSKTSSSDTVLNLSATDPSRLSIPATVTIPANQASASFQFNAVNDSLANGSEMVIVTAKASSYLVHSGSATVTLHDNEPVVLSLNAPASALEGTTVQVTLSINAAASGNIVVSLASSDLSAILVPPNVTIPSGQSSVNFTAFAVDDGIIDGTRATTITAHVQDWTDATATINVLDNGHDITPDWPTFGNGPAHTGYQPIAVGANTYLPGSTMTYSSNTNGLNQVAISSGKVYVTPLEYYDPSYLSALDASSGTELWRHAFTSAYSINPPSADAGKIYVERSNGGSDSQLWCIDSASGATTWSAPYGSQGESYLAPAVYQGGVWMDGGTYGGLYGFNTSDGSQRFFNSTIGQDDYWTPAYYQGAIYTYVLGVFRAHDLDTGAILWSLTWPGSSAAPVVDSSRAFVLGSGNLTAIDLGAHTTAWSVNGSFKGYPAVASGVVYAMSNTTAGTILAYSELSGTLIGTYNTGDSTIYQQPIVTLDSLIVSGSSRTYIFNLQTFTLKQTISAAGLPSLANGVLYLAGGDNVLRTYYLSGLTNIVVALPASVSEGATVNGTLTLSKALSSSTLITLGSSDPGRVSLPASVTIPANQTSATFQLSISNDSALNGPESVTVTASGPGYLFKAGTAVIAVNDDEVSGLSLAAPTSASEGSSFSVTVTAGAAPLNNLQVSLSSNSTAVFVPPTVTIQASQTSVTFMAYAADDGLVGGDRAATITAHVQGWTDGTATVSILDSGTNISSDWTMFGNGPAHTGYQATTLGAVAYQPGWTMSYQPLSTTLNQPAISGGEVFITPSQYNTAAFLSGLDASTGAELWRHSFASSNSINPPTAAGGNVYVQKGLGTGNDAQLFSLNAANGATNWTAPFGAQSDRYFAPTIYNNSIWIDGGLYGGLYGFNATTGSQLFFNSSLEEYDQWTPAYYNGTLYTWIAGNFRAHNPQTGAILWTINVGWNWSGYDMNTAPVIDLGHAYINASTILYAIDLGTHTNIWSVSGSFTGTSATNLGTVFIISSGNVLAFNGTTGALVGTYATGDTSLYGQPIVTPDSLIVASASKTYIFNRQSFTLKQTLPNGGIASLASGVLYLAGTDGVLHTYYPNGQTNIALTLPASVTEGNAPATGSASLSKALPTDTVINLTASDSSRLLLPSSVTIPANQTSVSFQLSAVDDAILNGSENVTVTAKALSYVLRTATAIVAVNDNETAVLSLSAPATAVEGTTIQATLGISSVSAVNVAVSLSSSDITALAVPASVTIPAGQTQVSFSISVVDNGLLDPTRPTTITAHVPGWTDGVAVIGVVDNGHDVTFDWPTFGNGPAHPGYQPVAFGSNAFQAGWSVSYPTSSLNPVAVASGEAFVVPRASTSYLSALDTASGTELWRHAFTAASTMNPPTADSGQVYVQRNNHSPDAQLFKINATTGATTWSVPFEAQWDSFFAPTVYQGGVWIDGGYYGGLYGLNTSDGSQRFFNSSLAQYDQWTPAYYNGTIYTWVAGVFRAHNPNTGAILWSLTETWNWNGYDMNRAIAIDQNRAFVIGNPNLYAIDLTSQNAAWTVAGTFTGTPATANGIVYAISSGNVIAYNLQSGAVVGTYATGDTGLSGQPIVTTDSLIVSSSAKTYLFNLQTFALKQTLTNGGAVSLANGILYLAGTDGILRTFHPNGMVTISVALPASATEGDPSVTGTVTLSLAKPTSTIVNLTANGSTRVSVPFSVTIPANQTSATFQLNVVDDFIANGTETVAVRAKGPGTGFYGGFSNITINDNDLPNTTILNVTPAGTFISSGNPGGPFTPATAAYVLSNYGTASMNWTAAKTASWLTLAPASGALAPGASTTVTASLSAGANSLGAGTYGDTITLTNTSSGVGNTTRSVSLTVGTLAAPVLTPMMAFTGGASCSASWTSVSGATQYEVQAATDPAFTSPMTSGWISAKTYMFAPLTDGAQYYYRVHGGVNGPATAGAWSTMASSTQDASPPAIAVSSPASLSTMSSTLVLEGTASDAVSGVHSVSINGGPVLSTDGFAHWTATVKNLQVGPNVFTLSASDNAVPPNTKSTTVQITGIAPADANGNHLPDFWETKYGITGGATDDVLHSGVPNLLAYAFDIDPNAVDPTLLPSVSAEVNPLNGLRYLTLTYRRLLQNLGLTYQIEVSPDLLTWDTTQSAIEELAPAVPNADGLSETVTVRIHPALGTNPQYVRVRVIGN